MITASYFDPAREDPVEVRIDTVDDLDRLLGVVARARSGRGIPAVELSHPSGSSLSFAFDGVRAFLVWTDPLDQSHHSVGGQFEGDFVYDYFGSWSEAPGEFQVAFADAVVAAHSFVATGSPTADPVVFSPD